MTQEIVHWAIRKLRVNEWIAWVYMVLRFHQRSALCPLLFSIVFEAIFQTYSIKQVTLCLHTIHTWPLLHLAAAGKSLISAQVWGVCTQLAVILRPLVNNSYCFHSPVSRKFSDSGRYPSCGGRAKAATPSSRITSQFSSSFLLWVSRIISLFHN